MVHDDIPAIVANGMIGHSIADSSGMLLTMDNAVADFLQRSKAELRGLSYADITHPDDRSANVGRIRLLSFGEAPLRVRKRYILPSGGHVWATVQVSKFQIGQDQGRLVGTIFGLDFKERRAPPEALWVAAKAQSKLILQRNAALGADMFSDGAWTVLLCLYLAEAEGRSIDHASQTAPMGLSAISVARWLRALRSRSLIEFLGETETQPQLTQRGLDQIETLLSGTVTASF